MNNSRALTGSILSIWALGVTGIALILSPNVLLTVVLIGWVTAAGFTRIENLFRR